MDLPTPARERLPDDRAVSPVIGVILMVAITVILAATVGSFIMGMASNVEENVNAGATVNFDSGADEVTVMFTSNQNADHLNVSITNQSTGATMYFDLGAVGSRVTVGPSGNTTTGPVVDGSGNVTTQDGIAYSVVVTAVKGDARTVVVSASDSV